MNVNPFSYLIEKLKGYVSKSGDTVFGDLTVNAENGTAGADAYTYLKVGNQTPKSSAKHSTGLLRLCGENGKYTDIYAPNSTASRDIVLPNASGTVALTSDIPTFATLTIYTSGKSLNTPYTENLPTGYTSNNCTISNATYFVFDSHYSSVDIASDTNLKMSLSLNNNNQIVYELKGAYSAMGELRITLAKI